MNGGFESAYLIYRSERIYDPLKIGTVDSVKITCSSCGHTFYAEKIPAGSCRHSYAPAPFGWRNEEMSNSVIVGDERSHLCLMAIRRCVLAAAERPRPSILVA